MKNTLTATARFRRNVDERRGKKARVACLFRVQYFVLRRVPWSQFLYSFCCFNRFCALWSSTFLTLVFFDVHFNHFNDCLITSQPSGVFFIVRNNKLVKIKCLFLIFTLSNTWTHTDRERERYRHQISRTFAAIYSLGEVSLSERVKQYSAIKQ